MISLNNVIKGAPINEVFHRIDINGDEHLFVENKSGSVIHIDVNRGITRVVLNSPQTNDYYYTAYSQLSNCYYIMSQDGGNVVKYDPLTGEIKCFDGFQDGGFVYSNWSQFHVRYVPWFYVPMMSTDGHIYLSQYIHLGLHGYVRFNVLTETFDEHSAVPDKEFTHIHGRFRNDAMYIDTGALAGVYSSYIWSNAVDDYVHLRDTIMAEIASAGLAVVDTGTMWIHQDDRDLASVKRRILYNVGTPAGNKFIDIKSPATWINNPANTNQAGTPVDTTNWITGVKLYDLAAQAGLTVPTLEVGLAYSQSQKVGRYVYVGHSYLGNKTHFFVFPIHPVTGEAMYPYSFNKRETFLQSSRTTYKCNFRGNFGFSNDDELVNFINANGSWHVVRPDTHTFMTYDPIADPDDYVIRAVNLNSISDPDGFGVHHVSRFTNATISTINGEDWYVDANSRSKAALSSSYGQNTVGSLTDLTYRFLPDKSKPTEVLTVEAKGVYATAFDISQAIVVGTSRVVCIGTIYSGATFLDISGGSYTIKKYLGDANSPNGAIRAGNFILAYGYSGTTDVYDITDWNNIIKFTVHTGETNEVMYMVERPEGVLSMGLSSRSVGHHEGCAFSIVSTTNRTVVAISNRFPNEFNRNSATSLRAALSLTGSGYTDVAVEAAVQAYMTSQSLTRSQVIDLFLDTCRWRCLDGHTYGNKTVLGLKYQGVLGLDGIRIEETVGSGVWINSDYYSSEGAKALLVDTADILNVAPGEIKPVEFNLTPNINDIGRLAASGTYLAFIVNDPTNSKGIIRVVTKTAFEAAANGSGVITSLDRVIEVNFNSTSNGYGFGDANRFTSHATHYSNAFVVVGNLLYITCISNVDEGGGLYPCVLKVDLSTGGSEVFVKSATRLTRAISYEGTRMLITNGTSLVVNDNFTTQVGSITI